MDDAFFLNGPWDGRTIYGIRRPWPNPYCIADEQRPADVAHSEVRHHEYVLHGVFYVYDGIHEARHVIL